MYKSITDNIFYVGVNERTVKKFENIWPVPHGFTCNSYLIVSDKIALIDGVTFETYDKQLKLIKSTTQGRTIDYLIINHVEPDHSSSIALLVKDFPDITLVGNSKTIAMLKGFYKLDCQFHEVKDQDELDLGQHTLQFYMTPMLHWPETMMTYEKETKTLFSGDGFGCFGALNGHIIDRDLELDLYYAEMRRYYACIVGKYGIPVQQALSKVGHLEIKTICSTHGPIWQDHIQEVIGFYDQYSRYEATPGVVIAYGSMYGNTAEMAEEIARELAQKGTRNIVLHDLCVSNISYVLSDIFKYDTLILGSSVYNGDVLPDMKALLTALELRMLKNRKVAAFGTFAWGKSGHACFEQFAQKLNLEFINPVLSQKYTLDTEGEDNIKGLVDKLIR